MNRRGFLAMGAAGAVGWLGRGRAEASGQPSQSDIPYGESRLGLTNDLRGGTVYVPK